MIYGPGHVPRPLCYKLLCPFSNRTHFESQTTLCPYICSDSYINFYRSVRHILCLFHDLSYSPTPLSTVTNLGFYTRPHPLTDQTFHCPFESGLTEDTPQPASYKGRRSTRVQAGGSLSPGPVYLLDPPHTPSSYRTTLRPFRPPWTGPQTNRHPSGALPSTPNDVSRLPIKTNDVRLSQHTPVHSFALRPLFGDVGRSVLCYKSS